MSGHLAWERDGKDWPNRAYSRLVEAGGLNWHVQSAGSGPPLLLLHGTGASTHSWRDLMPLLAEDFSVIAPDLPGHGFTRTPPSAAMSLPGMAGLLGALLSELGVKPEVAVGHSAGGAIMLQMALDGAIAPTAFIGLNAALRPFGGHSGRAFSSLARLFALNPLVSRFFSWQAGQLAAVRGLIEGTGSSLDEVGLALYQRLFLSRAHVQATITMMSNWDLVPLNDAIGPLTSRLHLVVASGDKAVSPEDARQMKRQHPEMQLHVLRRGGHLVHEEYPREVAALIREIAMPAGLRKTG
jgi:magnesium chelatase accessory protein